MIIVRVSDSQAITEGYPISNISRKLGPNEICTLKLGHVRQVCYLLISFTVT